MSKLKVFIIITALTLVSSVAFCTPNPIDGTTTLSLEKYQCTVTKVELSNGNDFITVATSSEITNPTMDIASVSFDEEVARFLQDLNIPEGTYVQCRMTLAPTFVIRGTVSYEGTTWRTTATLASDDGAAPEDATLINTDDDGNPESYIQTVAVSLTITRDQTTTAKVIMSTDNCLGMEAYEGQAGTYIIIPKEPSWTMTQE